jgi:serine phosphatase RsbU (regulator of sigma subunit)
MTAYCLRRALGVIGHEVVGEARNGLEAVARAAELRPDLVLMDVHMPEMDGMEATGRIMCECPTAVVMVTASEAEDVVAGALRAGACGYVLKPVQLPQLRTTISVARSQFLQLREFERETAQLQEQNVELALAREWERQVIEEAERRAVEAQLLARQLKYELQREQHAARTLAETFLAQTIQLPDFQVATRYEPASEVFRVGGDYFDFIELGERRIGVVIGDVCGKGAPAAAYTAKARYMLRAYAIEDPSPSGVLNRLNRALCEQGSSSCQFLTLVYGVLDLESAAFTYGNAGHPPPILLDPETGYHELRSTGTVLAVAPELEWDERTVRLAPGAVLALFTDGVTEARRSGEMWGHAGIRGVLEAHRSKHAPAIATALYDSAAAFAGGHMGDDVAIVVIRHAQPVREAGTTEEPPPGGRPERG